MLALATPSDAVNRIAASPSGQSTEPGSCGQSHAARPLNSSDMGHGNSRCLVLRAPKQGALASDTLELKMTLGLSHYL